MSHRGQFILTTQDRDVPPAWRRWQHGSWILGCDPALPVRPFGQGWILGWPLAVLPGVDPLVWLDQSRDAQEFERHLNALSGRFLAIAFDRVYLDAGGLLAAVYCPSQGIVSSNPRLIRSEERTELATAMDVATSSAYFAFGLTPRHGVHRLLPNHYLDLTSFQAVRHWLPPVKAGSAKTNIEEIVNGARGCIEAVTLTGMPYMSITAGRDTRMLLAIGKTLTDRLSFFTYDLPDRAGDVDVAMGRKLAAKFRLKHEVIKFVPPLDEHVIEWLERSGNAVGCRGKSLATVKRGMDERRPMLFGAAAEVGRAFFWRDGDEKGGAWPSPAELVQRMYHLPQHPEIVAAAERWLCDLPSMHVCDMLDLLYTEQRLGCWLGPSIYPENFAMYIAPFSNRRIFECMLSLPYDYRREQCMADDIIKDCWPELLQYPYNPPLLRHWVTARASQACNAAAELTGGVPGMWRASRALRAAGRRIQGM